MLSLMTVTEASVKIANAIKQMRLSKQLTQEGLANRAGVNLATYRRFERTGKISFEGYLKLMNAVGLMEDAVAVTENEQRQFQSIDEVLKTQDVRKLPGKGTRK